MTYRLLALMALGLFGIYLPGCSRAMPNAPEDMESAVGFSGTLANSHVSSQSATEVTAHLKVVVQEQQRGIRPPVNLALVIDTSGSTRGDAIAAARTAAARMIDELKDGDRLAVVVFHSFPEVLLPSTPLDDDARAMAKERVGAMKAHGTTDMAGGLASGIDEVSRYFEPEAVNRIVLLGDGIPNVEPRVRELAQLAGHKHISVTAFGLGNEYDETLMGAIAQLSGGRFHYVEDPDDMLAFFQREALRMDSVLAHNASLELVPGPGVEVVGVVGQQMVRRGGRATVSLGDMSLGESRDLLVRLQAQPHTTGSAVELIDATLRFDDPRGGVVERRVYLGATASDSEAHLEQGRDRVVERTAARITAAAATLAAIEQSRQGDDVAARKQLRRATKRVRQQLADSDENKDEDEALERQAESMEQLDAALDAPARPKVIRSTHDEAMQMMQ
jgi:Ca-activated chloride channel family protein